MSSFIVRHAMVAVLIAGILLPIVVGFFPRGPFVSVIAVLAALCWPALALLYPVVALSRGYITAEGGTTHRYADPIRFWVGLATHELLFCFAAVLAAGLLQMYLVPARP
ncbi:MAG: hypothetical protein Q8O81_08245 [Giesbergeria sp.]|nr:hypothetical protein [Giesbergeria sp.]